MSNNWPFPTDNTKKLRDSIITRIMVFRNDLRYSQFTGQDLKTLEQWLTLVRNGHKLPFEV